MGHASIFDKWIVSIPRKLTLLSIHHNDYIIDASAKSLPPTLIYLDVSWCKKLTDKFLEQLPQTIIFINAEGTSITNIPSRLKQTEIKWL